MTRPAGKREGKHSPSLLPAAAKTKATVKSAAKTKASKGPELTKRPEFYSYGTNQERQAAFLLTSGIVLSGLNPTVFSDRPCCGPPQT